MPPRRLIPSAARRALWRPSLSGAARRPTVGKNGYWGPPVDVWAFGCLCFETVTNKNAFNAESIQALNVRIIKASHNQFNKTTSSKCVSSSHTFWSLTMRRSRPLLTTRKICSMFKVMCRLLPQESHDRLRRAHHQGRAPKPAQLPIERRWQRRLRLPLRYICK